MFAILLLTWTLTYSSTFEDFAKKTGLLVKTADFLPPEEIARSQGTNRLARDKLGAALEPSPIILTASKDSTAKLWNADTGEVIRTFEGHTRLVTSAQFSKNGKRILTASADRTAKLWDVETEELIRTFEGHTDSVESAVFSNYGGRILTASFDKTAKLWNVETGEVIHTLHGHEYVVNSAVFSNDGDRILTASLDKTAKLWDVHTGEEISFLNDENDEIDCIQYYLLKMGLKYSLNRTLGHSINSAAFSPDGNHILTASGSTAILWNKRTGEWIRDFDTKFLYLNSAVFSKDGNHILTASDRRAMLWDKDTGELIRTFDNYKGSLHSAVFSRDGNHILVASADGTAKLLKNQNKKTGRVIRTFEGHNGDVNSAVFSNAMIRISRKDCKT